MNPAQKKIRVAFSFPGGMAMTERIQKGIASRAREFGNWHITRLPENIGSSIGWLKAWKGDGALVFITSAQELKIAQKLKFPVVNLASHLLPGSLPTVSVDHYGIGRLAAENLLSKNFRRLAFYGASGFYFGQERLRGFRDAIEGRGSFASLLVSHHGKKNHHWEKEEEKLDRWLEKLQKPVGVFAATDSRAGILLDACNRLGLKVPHDVAVLGVDNDEIVCELCEPMLSSVSRNDFEVGRQAAILLEKLIRGETPPDLQPLIRPDGVITRESTQTIAVDDPIIAEVLCWIQSQITRPFGVEEIAATSSLSRRRFETRFRQALGRSPYTFINDLRVNHAKTMLDCTKNTPLTKIASACGFSSVRRFRLVFQRTTGVLPSAWRVNPSPDGSVPE